MSIGNYLEVSYENYISGGISKKVLESRIFECVLENRFAYGINYFVKDECIDFLIWFYPRMSRTISRYEKIGATFTSFLSSVIKFSFKEYKWINNSQKMIEKSTWEERHLELAELEVRDYGLDNEVAASIDKQNHTNIALSQKRLTKKRLPNPRQVLMLFLKSYYFTNDMIINLVAEATGINEENIIALVEQIKELRLSHDEMIRKTADNISSEYYRSVYFQKQLREFENNFIEPTGKEKILTSLARSQAKIKKLRERLQNKNYHASNSEIAKVLGVSKGTVASNLYALKHSKANRKYFETVKKAAIKKIT